MNPKHRILLLNAMDHGGGAEMVAQNLRAGLRSRGHDAQLLVGHRLGNDKNTLVMPTSPWRQCWSSAANRLSGTPGSSIMRRKLAVALKALAQPRRACNFLAGKENFDYPATARLLELTPKRPTILHGHNLHSDYFDLRFLPALSKQAPTMLTLHDAWLLGGHCAHSFDCARWQTGCGNCPYLNVPMHVFRDRTAKNWQQKKDILQASRLYIATPSQWLMQRVEQSILAPAIIQQRVIPNGIDLTLFCPSDKRAARSELGIDVDADVILCSGAAVTQNPWKDYQTIRKAIELIGAQRRVEVIVLGARGPSYALGGASVQFVAFTTDLHTVARYYQAADIYLHAAKADTFPTTILEALACGAGVVATDVGGIGEQITHEQTGVLVPQGDPQSMAQHVVRLLDDDVLRRRMGKAAADDARDRFGLERQIDSYVRWYDQIAASAGLLT